MCGRKIHKMKRTSQVSTIHRWKHVRKLLEFGVSVFTISSLFLHLCLSLARCLAPFSSRSAFLAQISPKKEKHKKHRSSPKWMHVFAKWVRVCQCTLACMCAVVWSLAVQLLQSPSFAFKKSLAFLYYADVLRERNVEIAEKRVQRQAADC